MRVLVVEDERRLLAAIATVFREESFQVDEADNGEEGLFLAEQGIYDLVVLDWMLPGMDGLDLIRELRVKSQSLPIMLLTARDSVENRVTGLDTGADDYVIKPFAVPELLARARALLRRRGTLGLEGEIGYGGIALRPKEQDGYVGGEPLKLTSKEYELLEFLLCNKEQILTRGQILDRIWGFDTETGYGIVDLYIHYLRKKMQPFGLDHLIHTVRSVGYILKGK